MIDKQFCATKAFINYEGKILILRESEEYKGKDAGDWDIPGGRIKPGESPIESLRREIREETNLSVQVGEPFYIASWEPRVNGEQWQIIGTTLKCNTNTNKVSLSKDHDKYKWIEPENYRDFSLNETLPETFRYYINSM
ncbi:MAG: NUDIX domain-containing protein [Candidatus Paceibacteria bacterium]